MLNLFRTSTIRTSTTVYRRKLSLSTILIYLYVATCSSSLTEGLMLYSELRERDCVREAQTSYLLYSTCCTELTVQNLYFIFDLFSVLLSVLFLILFSVLFSVLFSILFSVFIQHLFQHFIQRFIQQFQFRVIEFLPIICSVENQLIVRAKIYPLCESLRFLSSQISISQFYYMTL